MISLSNTSSYDSLDSINLRNHFSVLDFKKELSAKNGLLMKSSNKIKNIEKSDYSKIYLSNKEISNRAFAQIRRWIKEYSNKKKNYEFQSNYISHLLKNLIPHGTKKDELKKYTIPLIASFIVTDGYTTTRRKKEIDTLELGFSNNNLELINAFNDLIFLTYGEIPSSIDFSSRTKRTRFVASWHGPMINEIMGHCYKNNKKSVSNLLISNNKTLAECFRIAMSCDGFVTCYVSKDKYGFGGKSYYNRVRASLQLGCKPSKLREDWKKVTERLNLKFNMKKDRIKSTSYKSFEIFLKDQGGFIPGTFIKDDSKYFKKEDKNKVLETLINIKKDKLNNIISNEKEGKLLMGEVIKRLK